MAANSKKQHFASQCWGRFELVCQPKPTRPRLSSDLHQSPHWRSDRQKRGGGLPSCCYLLLLQALWLTGSDCHCRTDTRMMARSSAVAAEVWQSWHQGRGDVFGLQICLLVLCACMCMRISQKGRNWQFLLIEVHLRLPFCLLLRLWNDANGNTYLLTLCEPLPSLFTWWERTCL